MAATMLLYTRSRPKASRYGGKRNPHWRDFSKLSKSGAASSLSRNSSLPKGSHFFDHNIRPETKPSPPEEPCRVALPDSLDIYCIPKTSQTDPSSVP